MAQFNFDEKKVLPKPRAFAQQKQLLPQIRSLQYQVSHCFSTSSNAIFKKQTACVITFYDIAGRLKIKTLIPFVSSKPQNKNTGGTVPSFQTERVDDRGPKGVFSWWIPSFQIQPFISVPLFQSISGFPSRELNIFWVVVLMIVYFHPYLGK